jgi:hypothetical protein
MPLTGKKFIDPVGTRPPSAKGTPKIRGTGRGTYRLIQSKVTIWHSVCDKIGIKGFGSAVTV